MAIRNKSDVEISYHQGTSGSPMICVKMWRGSGTVPPSETAVAERFGCSEEVATQALEYAIESAREQFWDDAQQMARKVFGPFARVYSAGRSGGWLVVEGLPDLETWDAIMLAKWRRFYAMVTREMAWLLSEEAVFDAIEANRWA